MLLTQYLVPYATHSKSEIQKNGKKKTQFFQIVNVKFSLNYVINKIFLLKKFKTINIALCKETI